MVWQTLNFVDMDFAILFGYLGIVCLSLLAVIGVCNVFFSADDDPDLRVRIRPLWLQRICRFFLVVAGVLLLWMDVIFLKEAQHILDEDVMIQALKVLGGFFFVGVLLAFTALVFYAFCNFIAFLLKELAKYVWNE